MLLLCSAAALPGRHRYFHCLLHADGCGPHLVSGVSARNALGVRANVRNLHPILQRGRLLVHDGHKDSHDDRGSPLSGLACRHAPRTPPVESCEARTSPSRALVALHLSYTSLCPSASFFAVIAALACVLWVLRARLRSRGEVGRPRTAPPANHSLSLTSLPALHLAMAAPCL